MVEAAPVVGWLVLLVLVVVPTLTLLAKLALGALHRWAPGAWRTGDWLHYGLLVAPVLLPLAWFVSAALHHAEPGMAARVCIQEHLDEICLEPLSFLLVIALAVLVGCVRLVGRIGRTAARAPRAADEQLGERLSRLDVPPAIRPRIVVVEGDALHTVGLLRPAIELGRQSAEWLDDEALTAALRHEAAHLGGYDPLRYALAMLCTSLNPLGRLLDPELARWRVAREQACDREAVHRGADPLALAEAILICARRAQTQPAVGLTGLGAQIRGRIALLVGYRDAAPGCTCSPAGRWLTLGAALLFLAWPHFADAWPLLDLHTAIEALVAQVS